MVTKTIVGLADQIKAEAVAKKKLALVEELGVILKQEIAALQQDRAKASRGLET
jgi:hypothetical protein